jgi:hypothetical protein
MPTAYTIPGPKAGGEIDAGTLQLIHNKAPVCTGDDPDGNLFRSRVPEGPLVVAEYDDVVVTKFLRSVAVMKALDYLIQPAGGAGSAGVTPDQLKKTTDDFLDKLFAEFEKVLPGGHAAIQAFLKEQEEAKKKAQFKLQQKQSAEQAGVESQVAFWSGAMKVAAGVQFASTFVIKTINLVPGPKFGSAVEFVYDLALDAIKTFNEPEAGGGESGGKMANVGVTAMKKTGEGVLQEAASTAVEKVAGKSMGEYEKQLLEGTPAAWLKRRQQLHAAVERAEKMVENGAGKGAKRLRDATGKVTKFRKATVLGGGKELAGKSVSIFFYAKDISEAWDEFMKVYREN